MRFRFNLDFAKVDSRRWLELRREHPANIYPWAAVPHAISSIDYLRANLPALAAAPRFDLVIIDEAHHVARAYAGPGRSTVTDRSRLARLLAEHSRELLLLSATPHNGYAESFASLAQLLGTHLAADDGRLDREVVRPHVLRRLKDDVTRGDLEIPALREVGPPAAGDPQGQTRLAVLYEEVPGGAGYLRQLGERLGEVANVVAPVLDGCACERACYACLKSYANQGEHELLDRRVALGFLAPWAGTPDVEGRRLPSFSDGFVGVPRSPIERLLALALIDLGAPPGRTQYPSLTRRGDDGIERLYTMADFGWGASRRVAVYCDGWEHHSSDAARAADQDKRNALRAEGWTVLAFWGGEITRDARRCAQKVLKPESTDPIQSAAVMGREQGRMGQDAEERSKLASSR